MPAPPSLRTTATLSRPGFGGLVIGRYILLPHQPDREVIDRLDRMDRQIFLLSSANEGSTFEVELPSSPIPPATTS